MSKTLTVRGHKLRTQTQRRYIVVAVPFGDHKPHLHKRSDSLATARTHAQRYGWSHGASFAVVVDTSTGQEV